MFISVSRQYRAFRLEPDGRVELPIHPAQPHQRAGDQQRAQRYLQPQQQVAQRETAEDRSVPFLPSSPASRRFARFAAPSAGRASTPLATASSTAIPYTRASAATVT